jgi:hypothetical protein
MQMKKLLVIGIVLALMLTLVLPSVAMAARPTTFSAAGTMASIDPGTVKELGNSGLWLVKDRHIQGRFLSGDLGTESYTITYGGVFKLVDQSGNLAGTMQVGSKLFVIDGKVAPLSLVDMGEYQLPQLTISGHWAGLKGVNATGSFNAYMIFVPTADGHVDYIVASSFDMTGKYVK